MYQNTISVVGRLVANPMFTSGKKEDHSDDRSYFRVAVNRPGQDKADFIPVITWGKLARACAEHLKKGKEVAIAGALHTNSTQDESGKWDNRFEIAASSVSFGADAKNTGKPVEASRPVVVAPSLPEANPLAALGISPEMQVLLLQALAMKQAAPAALPATENPFSGVPLPA
jgi:single-strand DNA-binding protein